MNKKLLHLVGCLLCLTTSYNLLHAIFDIRISLIHNGNKMQYIKAHLIFSIFMTNSMIELFYFLAPLK